MMNEGVDLSRVKFCVFVCEKYNEVAVVILDKNTDMFLFRYDVAIGCCRCNGRDNFHEYYGEVFLVESEFSKYSIVSVSSRVKEWCDMMGVNPNWLLCMYDEFGNYMVY